MTGAPFSLLMSFYRGDDPRFFEEAFRSSVDAQTRPPAEVVLVRDGRVADDLASTVRALIAASPVPTRLIELPDNVGLAAALERGLRECSHDIVARMDADDISVPDRFARQLPIIEAGAELVGTGMYEFLDHPEAVVGQRVPPTGAERIASYARFHDPFNHPTVVYRRAAVERAGGYLPLGLMEDYWLFARMIHAGAVVENVADPLLRYRVGSGAFERRGGFRQFRSEVMLQRALRRIGFTTPVQCLRNLLVRGGYRFVPVAVRKAAYRRVFGRSAGAAGPASGPQGG